MNSKQINQKFFYKGFKALLFLFFFLISHVAFAQTDFLGISSITLGGQVYSLKWSVNNARQERIIQEYLLPDESITRYNTKLILEYIRTGKTVEDIVDAKLDNLGNEKQEGRVLNFKKLESADPDEMVLEFMVGNMREGKTRSIEWNVYRYKPTSEGIILFIMSKRAYGEKNVNAFMKKVNENRLNWINSIVNYELPEISVKK